MIWLITVIIYFVYITRKSLCSMFRKCLTVLLRFSSSLCSSLSPSPSMARYFTTHLFIACMCLVWCTSYMVSNVCILVLLMYRWLDVVNRRLHTPPTLRPFRHNVVQPTANDKNTQNFKKCLRCGLCARFAAIVIILWSSRADRYTSPINFIISN